MKDRGLLVFLYLHVALEKNDGGLELSFDVFALNSWLSVISSQESVQQVAYQSSLGEK